jgi:hypothetical protein
MRLPLGVESRMSGSIATPIRTKSLLLGIGVENRIISPSKATGVTEYPLSSIPMAPESTPAQTLQTRSVLTKITVKISQSQYNLDANIQEQLLQQNLQEKIRQNVVSCTVNPEFTGARAPYLKNYRPSQELLRNSHLIGTTGPGSGPEYFCSKDG